MLMRSVLSNKHLDQDTKCTLGYGLNFAFSSDSANSVEITKGICNLEKYGDISSEEVNIVKGIIYGNMKKQEYPNCPKRFMVAINKLKSDDNIHITKADKSGAVVVLNKIDCDVKINFLRDENTYKELNKKPLDNVNRNFNKKVKELVPPHIICQNMLLIFLIRWLEQFQTVT